MNAVTVALWVAMALFAGLTVQAARNDQTTVPSESRMLVVVFSALMTIGCGAALVVRWT